VKSDEIILDSKSMRFVERDGKGEDQKYTELDIIDNWTGLREELVGGNSFLVRLEAMSKEPLDLERNENFLAEGAELDAAQPNLVHAQEIQAFLDKNRGSLVEESLTYQTLKSVVASKLSFSSTFHTSHNLTPSSTFASLDPNFAKSYLSQLMTLRLPFSPIDLTHLRSIYSSNTLLSFTKKKSNLSLPTLSQHLHLDLTPKPSKNFYQFTVNLDQKLIQKKCLTIYENTAKLMEICNGILNERVQLLEWAGMNKLFQVKCKLDAYGIDIEGSNVGLYNFYSGVEWMHKLCGFLGKGDGGILVGYEEAVDLCWLRRGLEGIRWKGLTPGKSMIRLGFVQPTRDQRQPRNPKRGSTTTIIKPPCRTY
jgi:hypothetical protein